MKKILITILAMYVLMSCASVQKADQKRYEVIKKADSVVVIRAMRLRRKCVKPGQCVLQEIPIQGSGFKFAQGYIMTNAHVIAQSVLTMAINRKGGESYCTVVMVDPVADIAILKYHDDTMSDLEVLEFEENINIGDRISTIGAPRGFSWTISHGYITAKRLFKGVLYLQSDAQIHHGSSGGVLMNRAGKVVGMTTMMTSPGINFSVAAGHIKAIIKAWRSK